MKRIIMLYCILLLVFSNAVFAKEFSDMVSEEHWAYKALNYACESEIIQGFEDNTVRPDESLTRAQMAAIIVRKYSDGSTADISGYVDISENAWYYDYFKEAVGMSLFQGDGNGLMNPDNNISRQETFVVIGRLLNVTALPGNTVFKDDSQIAEWSKGIIKALHENKYISGDSNQCINAQADITRAEFAQLIYNIRKTDTEKVKNPVDIYRQDFCFGH